MSVCAVEYYAAIWKKSAVQVYLLDESCQDIVIQNNRHSVRIFSGVQKSLQLHIPKS